MTLRIREPFNAISHLGGAAAALVASGALLMDSVGMAASRAAALVVYGLSLVGLFSASGVYHWAEAGPRTMRVLRKIDHSAIYLLIAGTYTPFCVIAFRGFWQWGLLAIIWALAIAGIAVKIFIINTPRWLTAGLYVLMGWLSVFAAGQMVRLAPVTFGWLLAGGILYTLGAVVYVTKKGDFFPGVFGFHEVWHIFVLLGAAAHFVAVASLM